jgi:hypothetical protein
MNTNDDEQTNDDDEQVARLLAEAEREVRLSLLWGQLMTAVEREQFVGPVRAAHYAGERAAAIARTAADREGASAEEVQARAKRAFWYSYFHDLAAEATARAELARAELARHGEEVPE